jgi:CTP synthase
MTSDHNVTTGKTYQSVIEAERAGDYLGKTVQIIPHVTDDIKRRIREAAEGTDVCIVEIGGTVGDIESMPFLESLRQFASEEADEDLLFMHVTLVPDSMNGEQKTKPTQHSVKELRSIGLQPDILVGRNEERLEEGTKTKIARFCDVSTDAVFSNPDVDDIYKVPLMVEDEGLDEYVMDRLGIAEGALPKDERSQRWRELVTRERSGTVEIALVGKYGLEDAYMSIHEALKHAGIEQELDVDVLWVDSDEMHDQHRDRLEAADGIIVPGGFGSRGTDGKIEAVRYARENDVPFLGLCLGFQMAVIEQARNVLDLNGAHSAEIDEETPHPVIDILPEQKEIDDMGGTMRLGAHETQIESGTLAEAIYEADSCTERHRHRYEVNPNYIEQLESETMTFSGTAGRRMEILELDDHPFFFGTQFHPEFRSRPDRASPPFVGFLEAILDQQQQETDTDTTEDEVTI